MACPSTGVRAVLLANSSLVDTGALHEAVEGAGATVVGVKPPPESSTQDFARESGLTIARHRLLINHQNGHHRVMYDI